MKLKLLFQIVISLLILILIVIFYYSFLSNTNFNNSNKIDETKKTEEITNISKDITSQLTNIEYNSEDRYGNSFYINAGKATVINTDDNQNLVELEEVVSIINLNNKGIVTIFSNKALYNKLNNNTLFYNNVKMEFLDNSILSENLDIIFTENITKIYNNVIFENNKFELNTDNILIDMITGDINLKMKNKNTKVKLVSKYDLID